MRGSTILTTGILVLAIATLSYAQGRSPRARLPRGGDRGGQARPSGADTRSRQDAGGGRGSARRPAPPDRQGAREDGRSRESTRRGGADFAEEQREQARTAEPRIRRPDNSSRTAVPRPAPLPRVDPGRYGPPARRYDSLRSPRRSRSYGAGPGYFFVASPFDRYPDRGFAWYGDFGGYGFGYPTGELRLEVWPQHAEVYVDGYYAGIVDDFDGFAQGLRLEEGPYHIAIVADRYQPVEFDVIVQSGRQISFARNLLREPYAADTTEPYGY